MDVVFSWGRYEHDMWPSFSCYSEGLELPRLAALHAKKQEISVAVRGKQFMGQLEINTFLEIQLDP